MTELHSNEDDLLTVAFSLQSNPGAYALLLGAGVSASSGIPTAWGVLTDLVAQVADLAGEHPADAISWYEARFGEHPTYEGVLERIAPTQIERQRALRVLLRAERRRRRDRTESPHRGASGRGGLRAPRNCQRASPRR